MKKVLLSILAVFILFLLLYTSFLTRDVSNPAFIVFDSIRRGNFILNVLDNEVFFEE
jgi:dolichyl-phosphate-mannose--protein O-mannosyl transferase